MKTQLNIELFKKMRDRIATIPESFNQDVWCAPSGKSPCGTVACLAGEAIICAAPTVEEGIRHLQRITTNDYDDGYGVPVVASRLLGLKGNYRFWGEEEETVIFKGGAHGWPTRYRNQFLDANDDPKKQADAAVAFLDHVIKTGKVFE